MERSACRPVSASESVPQLSLALSETEAALIFFWCQWGWLGSDIDILLKNKVCAIGNKLIMRSPSLKEPCLSSLVSKTMARINKMQVFVVIAIVALAYVNGCKETRPAKATNGMLTRVACSWQWLQVATSIIILIILYVL